MINKTFRLITGIAMLLALLSGCTTTANVPVFYSNNSNYDFIILGEVTYSGSTAGYQSLLRAARSKYPSCDYVIDIMIDSETKTTAIFFYTLKTSTTYTMRGTAIQYIRNIPEGQAVTAPAQNPAPSTPAGVSIADSSTGASIPSASISIADSYTVERLTGQVQRYLGDRWVYVRVGEVLSKDTRISTGRNSSLVLVAGSIRVTIPAGNRGNIESLIAINMDW